MELKREQRRLKASRSGAKAPHGPSTPATTPPNSPAPSRALRGRWRGRERSRPSCSRSQLRKVARRAEGVLLPARAAYTPGNLPPWPPQHPQRALRPAPAPPSESQFAIGGLPGTTDSVVLSKTRNAAFGGEVLASPRVLPQPSSCVIMEASPMPRSDFGQKVIFWAFYRQSSNFAALAQLLRARARAGNRKGHITG